MYHSQKVLINQKRVYHSERRLDNSETIVKHLKKVLIIQKQSGLLREDLIIPKRVNHSEKC